VTLQIGPTVEVGFIDKRRSGSQANTTPLGTPANYASISAMETRLLALGYTASQIRIMTTNDKQYALRLADDSAGI
jgi:hypothetical protein